MRVGGIPAAGRPPRRAAFANEVFPEARVVGPEGSVASLQREVASIPSLLERLRRSRDSYAEWAAATSPDSVEGREAREGVAAFELGIADLEQGIEPRYPTPRRLTRAASPAKAMERIR